MEEEDVLARYERLGFERRRRLHRREVVGRFAAFVGRPADGQQQLLQLQRRAAESGGRLLQDDPGRGIEGPAHVEPGHQDLREEAARIAAERQPPGDWRERF
jgi:hypothetical protein